jgi:hypothetical protein
MGKQKMIQDVKVKVTLSLQYREESRGSRGVAPLVLDFSTRWR